MPARFPFPRSKLFGRDEEIAAAEALLRRDAGVVTLVGAGGVGKTRLALELCARLAGEYAQGALFCDLSLAESRDDLCRMLAAQLEVAIAPGGSAPEEQLSRALAGRPPMLLCLDNLEQIAALAAAPIARWAEANPSIGWLCTSRERLEVAGERVLEITPLKRSEDAIELFIDRAHAIGLPVTPSERATVAAIVEAVDRWPLAIELAAVRTTVLGLEELRQMLPERWGLLESRRRDQPLRHQSLRATLAWSWSLSSEQERTTLARCALIRKPFDRHDAAAVVEADDIVERLMALRAKSLLVRHEVEASGQRFSMLRAVRDFAIEELEKSGSREARRAHARWLAEQMTSAAGGLRGVEPATAAAALSRVEEHLSDLDEALGWVSAEGDAVGLIEVTRAMLAADALFQIRGSLDAALARWSKLVDRRLGLPAELQAKSRLCRARLLRLAGRLEESAAELEPLPKTSPEWLLEASYLAEAGGDLVEARRTAALARRKAMAQDDPRIAALAATQLGRMAHGRDEPAEARKLLEEGLAWLRAAGDLPSAGPILASLGFVYQDLGLLDRAEALYREALALHRTLRHRRAEAVVLGYLGNVARRRYARAEAVALYDEAIAMLAAQGAPRFEGVFLMDKGILLSALGEPAAARETFLRAADRIAQAGDERCLGLIHGHLGVLAADADQREQAQQSFQVAESLLAPLGDVRFLSVLALQRHHLTLAAARAGEPVDLEPVHAAVAAAQAAAQRSEHMQLARSILERGLARTDPPDHAVRLRPDGRWLATAAGETDLADHPHLARVVAALARAHRERRPAPLSDLFCAGWPGERALPAAQKNRVRVALTTLRKAGIPIAFDKAEAGYRITAPVIELPLANM